MEQQIVLGRGGTRISARELKLEIDNDKEYILEKRIEYRKNTKNDLVKRKIR